jgi:hypothetical protein
MHRVGGDYCRVMDESMIFHAEVNELSMTCVGGVETDPRDPTQFTVQLNYGIQTFRARHARLFNYKTGILSSA